MKQTITQHVIYFIRKEIVLLVFLLLLVILALYNPNEIVNYPRFVDWKTIIALAGLLIITTGLKESGYFSLFSAKAINRFKSERSLSFFLILFAAFLSTFLTNDISLFIVIPLTFSIQDLVKNNISGLIVFEAIAVNVGSALTPIGNPQNIFLWHNWSISSLVFIMNMLPMVIVLLAILFVFIWFVFPDKRIKFSKESRVNGTKVKGLFTLSVILIIAYLISFELQQVKLLLPLVFILYFVFYRKVLLKVDWLLLLLFIIIFIDFHLISTLPAVSKNVQLINLKSAGNVFLFSGLISQFISNVPASVFVSKFSDNWFAITYGVNVGGNGLVFGSLANIIAMRLAKNKQIWLSYHKYSIPYFLITGGIIYVLFFIL